MSSTDYVSALDLFSVGIGPSSSHTVGPMRAARSFVSGVLASCGLDVVERVEVVLYGSLAATGLGHGTPDAVLAGLLGLSPETCDPSVVRGLTEVVEGAGCLRLLGRREVAFAPGDLRLAPLTRLPRHPNALSFEVFDASGASLVRQTFYSVGGGFVVREGEEDRALPASDAPLGFDSAAGLLALCEDRETSIAGIATVNEESLHGIDGLERGLEERWSAMESCIETGLAATGVLPGWMKVPRRAHDVAERLGGLDLAAARGTTAGDLPAQWLQAYALAVNEENAAADAS